MTQEQQSLIKNAAHNLARARSRVNKAQAENSKAQAELRIALDSLGAIEQEYLRVCQNAVPEYSF